MSRLSLTTIEALRAARHLLREAREREVVAIPQSKRGEVRTLELIWEAGNSISEAISIIEVDA